MKVGVEGHALAGLQPSQPRGAREGECERLVQGRERHQCIQFREHSFVELTGLVKVTAVHDPVDHHLGAGRRFRQGFEQGGKALLRIRAD